MAIPYPRALKTVDRFGVSIDQDQGQGPLLQPHVKYRFRILFLGFGKPEETAEPLTLNTNSVTLPNLTHETIQVHSYNSRAYYAGKHEWGTFQLTVRDTFDNTVTKAVGRQMQRQLDHYNQTGFASATDYKFRTMIQQLSGGHDDARQNYQMEGCFIESLEYGELDYSVSDMRTITMTIRPDNVIVEGEGAGAEGSVFASPGDDPFNTTLNR